MIVFRFLAYHKFYLLILFSQIGLIIGFVLGASIFFFKFWKEIFSKNKSVLFFAFIDSASRHFSNSLLAMLLSFYGIFSPWLLIVLSKYSLASMNKIQNLIRNNDVLWQ